MHIALAIRKLDPTEKSVLAALLKEARMGASKIMSVAKSPGSQAKFSRTLLSLEARGFIEKSGPGRQSPWQMTSEAKRFAIAPHMRSPVPFNDARVIGHGKPFLDTDQSRALETISPSRTDASTFIRSLSERFIIDLSWASSNLEGNTYDYLDTERLIRYGEEAEGKDVLETAMILNHKYAVEWVLEAAETRRGLTPNDVCVLHSVLMRGLLPYDELGAIRKHPVSIGGSSYRPANDPMMLATGISNALHRAESVEDPYEASMGLLAGMSYLQAFSDGNKRTARLLSSLPLLRAGLPPVSFAGWEKQDYTVGLLVFYETGDPSLLADGFVKNQMETAPIYQDLIRAHRLPNRIEVTRRKEIATALTSVLTGESDLKDAVDLGFRPEDVESAMTILPQILEALTPTNAVAWGVDPDILGRSEAKTGPDEP